MTDNLVAQLLSLLGGAATLGAVMPLVVAAVVRSHWPSAGKAATALGTSALAGTASAVATGELTGLGWPAAIVVALTASQLAYRKWWHPTGIAPWLEQLTQPKPPVIDGEVTESTTVETPAP